MPALFALAGVILAAVGLKFMYQQGEASTVVETPEARAIAAIGAVEIREPQRSMLEAWSRGETGDFKHIHGNSLFNIHIGDGRGPWAHRPVAGFLDVGAEIRDYDSMEQSVQDVLDLMRRLPRFYGPSLAQYEAGNIDQFFAEIAKSGFQAGLPPEKYARLLTVKYEAIS